MKRQFLLLFVALLLATLSSWAATLNVPGSYPSIQAAINAASDGDVIQLAGQTFVESSLINVNKDVTIQGMGTGSTLIQVSGTGYRFDISSAGVSIKDLSIQKTDKSGEQNIIWVHANNFTLQNTIMSGQFVIGDGDVSRAMVVSGGLNGLLIDGNTFFALRQPGYFSGPTTGIISNNNTYGTKGWVMEGGNMTFTGNTWGVNVFDIAILGTAPATAYTDIVAMSNANNDAVIEDQRVDPRVLSVVYVDPSTSFTTDLGGRYHPYSSMAPAIARKVEGGKIITIAPPGPTASIGTPSSTTCGTFDVPVTVKNFNNVGAISLVLNNNSTGLAYQPTGVVLNPAISAAADVNVTTPGKFVLGWFNSTGITLPDDAVLFTLKYNLLPNAIGGNTIDFTWSTEQATDCEFAAPGGNPVYANSFTNNTLTVPSRPVKNAGTGFEYCSIQAAIDDAQEDDAINVAAGTYAENLTVGKSLSIYGPNATTSGCSGSRVAEAILVPATNSPADWSSQLILLNGNSIRIAGLTLDGDNPLLGGIGDYNVSQGIVGITGQANIVIENNIIKNLASAGIVLADDNAAATTGNAIKNNKIDNINPTAGFGIGVYTGNNTYVDITNNCMTNVRKGIQGGENNHKANPAGVNSIWSGNSIQSYKIGIWNNLAYSAATPVTITGNTVTTVPGSTINSGIEISSIQGTSSVLVTNNTVTGAMAGINLWNNPTTATVTVGANTFTDCDYGVFANNFDGYSSNADPSSYVVDGAQIVNPKNAGVYVKDNSSNTNASTVAVQVKGNTSITGTLGTGFLVEGADASLSFSGATPASVSGTPKYIVLNTNTINVPAGNIDATAVSFDGKIGSAMSNTELFATEDKIDHKIDLKASGFVTVKALNAYVTDIATSAAANNDYTRIRNAVELVANSWNINLKGTFDWAETNAAASWALGNDGIVSPADDYGIYVPANLNGITFTALEGLGTASIVGPGDLPNANLEGVLVFEGGDNKNWTISNIEFSEFDMPIGMFNGAGGVDAFDGTIITNNKFDIATDLNTVVAPADPNQNIGLHFSFGTNQIISNNTFNIPGNGVSDGTNYSTTVAMQSNTSGGAVYNGLQITGNTINILNAQSANPQVVLGYWENSHGHSSNITVSNNKFLNLAPGNNPALNLQRGFRVTSHSSATSSVTYSENTVQGANIGFQWIAGSNFTGNLPVKLLANTLEGNNTGILVQSNGLATITNNFIKNGADGIAVEGASAVKANDNDLSLNTGLAIKNSGSLNIPATCNWYGTSAAAGVAAKISGLVSYTSWLTNGTDNELATVGFQPVPGSCGGTPIVIASVTPDDIICGETNGSILVTFSGGTAPYNITWDGGSATGIVSPYLIAALPAGVCNFTITDANFTTATSNATVLYLPVTNTTTTTYYPTIQAAINAATDGNVISVCAGTYAEDVVVNKELTLKGPNFGISPNGGTRVPEAIIVPATSSPFGEIIKVQKSNVTVDGFTISGDNTSLPASLLLGTNGATLDAAEAVTVYVDNVNKLKVSNNIIKNLTYFGVTIYGASFSSPATTNHEVVNNLFSDLGTYTDPETNTNNNMNFWGGGVLLYNNQYAAISNNTMTNVRLGIQTGNYSQANPGTTVSQLISGNTIQARKRGVFHNLFYSSASPYTLSNNTITGLANANETTFWDGILFASMQQTASTASGNTIDGTAVTALPKTGIAVWNCQVAPMISGGTISGVDLGINVNNFESYPSNGSNAGNTFATVDGVTITGATIAGVKVNDNPLNTNGAKVFAEIQNLTVSGTATGILVNGADANANIHNNAISAYAVGINVTGTSTSSTAGLTIASNTINFSSQLIATIPTTAILLNKVTGTAAATISSNTISGSYYGYMVYNLNTLPKTTIAGGTITGVMQGVAAINIDPAGSGVWAPSTLGVSDITMSGFAGVHTGSFHAGVYVYTGGAVDGTGITATVDKVVVNGTGKIAQDCAGLSFADFSTNAVNMQNITVTECTLTNNLNRGINIRGKNALVNIGTSTLTGNGSDPYGLGGNDGFGIIVRQGAVANVANCFITNPATVAGGYNVSALCTDPGTATNATINATENSLSQNGNTTSWLANNSNGTLATTCNWWGTALTSGIASKINGTVTYPKWLVDGTDASANAGFQPTADACIGEPVVMTCGVDVTVPACSTQTAVDAAYTAFLSSTTASGCNGSLSNNAPATAPSICGGSVDVTWTYTSECEVKTCTRTFTVTPAPAITLTCASNLTVVSCQTQTAVDAAYAAWLGTATAVGGCNGFMSNNSTGAPLATGGSKTVIFTWNSSCSPIATTCSATFTVAAPKTISGTLKYNNATKTPMNLVTLTLSPGGATCVTDANGYYSFPNLCDGVYSITVTDNKKDVGSINSTDAGAANAWGAGGAGLIEYTQFLAGDVTNDIYINSTDAQRIQKYFVNGLAFTRAPWSYWKKGVTIANTDVNPKPANFDVTVSGTDVTNFDLLGMCTGDFNGSLVPTTLKSAHSSLTLANKDQFNAVSGQEFELPIRAASAMQVGAVSMILDIPSNLVSIQNIKVNGSNDAVSWAVNGNELRIGWYSSTPVNVAENGNLLTLKLKTSNSFTVGSAMEFALQFNPLNELADGNFEVIKGANLLVAQVTNGNGITGLIDPTENPGLSFNNYPNPFRNSTTVDYKLPVNGKVTIDVYNQIGQLVQSLVNANQNAGNYSIRMDANGLMPGIYIARLRLTNTDVDMTGTVKLSVLK